jgi:DNA polymerase-3 subunit epsilon
MREIVLDTETTGLDPYKGDRLVEIGCVELVNRIPTGEVFHVYINPERDMPVEAFNVHGLSIEFLSDKPKFAEICDAFVKFIGDAPLVIHNAQFDIGFINAELERCGKPLVRRDQAVDTLLIARRKHAGGSNKLDDLCARYGIDTSRRVKHGALLDAEILAEVYVEMIEARQATLVLGGAGSHDNASGVAIVPIRVRPEPLPSRLTDEERDLHRAFVGTLGEKSIWNEYAPKDSA